MNDTAGDKRPGSTPPIRIRLDPTRCAGHGICALIAADRISLDAWGFAVVDATPIGGRALRRRARRVVAACPAGALSVEEVPDHSGSAAPLRR